MRRLLFALIVGAGSLAARDAAGDTGTGRASLRHAPIPAFARMYRTGCSTCHTAAPKLNVLGEVFRLRGYRMPDNDLLVRDDDPVPLGAEPWKEEWPRAIWPGDLPGQLPLALRIQTDIMTTRDRRADPSFAFRFPHEIYLLAGTPLGRSIGAFIEATWSPDDGFDVAQAKVTFQDLWPGQPSGAPDLWVGRLDPFLFSLANRQTDRAARARFAWQQFRLSDVHVDNTSGAPPPVTSNRLRLGGTMPAVELSGTVRSRLHWGLGVAQGSANGNADLNDAKDVYYKLRYKLGGLDLDGHYDPGVGPLQGAGGQLLDRSLSIEHFGYFGDDSAAGSPSGRHRAFGLALRLLEGRLDAGAGYVWRRFDRPYGPTIAEDAAATAGFGKLEYLVFPWVIASLKAEHFDVDLPASLSRGGFVRAEADETRVMPGVVLLLRQNVRAVAEAELFLEHAETARLDMPRPHTLWLRLDLAF